MLQTLNLSNLKFWMNWLTFSINYKLQKILHLSGVGISICFFYVNLDAEGGSPKLKIKSLSKLLSMLSKNDLYDIYRIRNPEAKHFTWRRKSLFKQRRLDCFLVSDTLQENIKAVGIIPSVQSNHSAMTLMLCPVTENVRGRAYWEFNSSLMQDNYFIDSLKSQILTFAREVFSIIDPIMRW